MIKGNPLFDIDFLTKLTEKREREIYARITALTVAEEPVEYIEGKVTAGSINVDGTSAVRRTCNLTMVAQDVNINEFYWGFKNKFILEIGLKNTINPKYPDIIWFKQGLFIITSFNTSQSTNNFTITINGKDKMCLLNGDISGHLPHSVDFGTEEYYDKDKNITTYTQIPIKRIIREALMAFGNELAQNIIINDLEEMGLELLEYRGNTPMYMFKEIKTNKVVQMTFNPSQRCYINGEETTISSDTITYDPLVELDNSENPTVITLSSENNATTYTIIKFEYGHNAGYRLTDLTYAGDLIGNVGETITSILDKIKNMLGNFEYFYNVDGKFVFQKKQNYLQTTWHIGEKNPDIIVNDAINTSFPIFSFMNAELITAFGNNPNILNVRNDFSVWGTYKSISGADIPIHMRLALDKKPTYYKSPYNKVEYKTEEYDWRELIYQMALDWRKHSHDDDFLLEVAAANPTYYPTGKTGYEQYYIDLEGFWRQLYNPTPPIEYVNIDHTRVKFLTSEEKELLAIKNPYIRNENKSIVDIGELDSLYVYKDSTMIPFKQSGVLTLDENTTYYYKNVRGEMNAGTTDKSILSTMDITLLYTKVSEEDEYQPVITKELVNETLETTTTYVKSDDYILWSKYNEEEKIKNLYYNNNEFLRLTEYHIYDNFGEKLTNTTYNDIYIYGQGYYEFNVNTYWTKTLTEAPETLLFWFDFLSTEGGDLEKFSVPVIGTRTKSINDSAVKTIYYREIPTTIFYIDEDASLKTVPTGYTYVFIPKEMKDLFSISSKGKSAQERIDELLQTHSYCIESTNITTVPVYHLEPNTRIYVRDDNSKIDGEYIVSKITIPLAYNGTMSLTTNKVVDNIM